MNASKNSDTKGSFKVLSLRQRDAIEFKLVSVDYFSGGDDIFLYYMVINQVLPLDPYLSSVVLLKRSRSYVPLVL